MINAKSKFSFFLVFFIFFTFGLFLMINVFLLQRLLQSFQFISFFGELKILSSQLRDILCDLCPKLFVFFAEFSLVELHLLEFPL